MYILALNNIFTSEETNITISRQPMITLSTVHSSKMNKRDIEGRRMGNRIMAIQFLIDYDIPPKQKFYDTSNDFDTSNTKIQLERFSIKSKTREKYDKLKHKPKVLTLNSEDESTFGFKIDIGDINYRMSRVKSNVGCQLISIYSELDGTKKSEDFILRVVDKFKQLFGIQDFKDTDKFGYRFKVEIKRFDDQPSIFIYSSMFKVVHQASFSEIDFESVDVDDYHI